MPVKQMFVGDVCTFNTQLEQSTSGVSYDRDAVYQIKEYFVGRSSDSKLTLEGDFVFLKKLFSERYHAVCDTPHDYTFSQHDSNLLWINLAKKMADTFDTTYIKILFPDIKNLIDSIDLAVLATTNNTTSFFVGDDNKTLFKKKSLCAYLKKKPSLLIIKEPNEVPKMLTIKELCRIKSSVSSAKNKFTIDEYSFDSVWDFLERMVFPTLNPSNELSSDLVRDFFLLIEQFDELKTKCAPISHFKERLSLFLKQLSERDARELSQFYGLHCRIENKTYYFIHFLIYLYQLNDYELDYYLTPLRNWLCTMNPSDIPVDDAYHQVMIYLIFLFSNDGYSGTVSVKVGNLTRGVLDDIARIYQRFESLVRVEKVNKSQLTQLKETYEQLTQTSWTPGLFAPKLDIEPAFLKKICADIDVQYYPAELLMYAMMEYKLHYPATIPIFLDKLIHVYCSNANEVEKQLQVNIIFAELLKKVDLKQRIELLLCLKKCSSQPYHAQFLLTCERYIKEQLTARVASEDSDAVKTLWSAPLAGEGYQPSVSGVISACKRRLDAVTHRVSNSFRQQQLEYLSQISVCDLSREQKDEIQNSNHSVDPLGVY